MRILFWTIRRAASPQRVFRRALKTKLQERANALYPNERHFGFPAASYAASTLAVVVLVMALFGSGAYAYENPEVNETSALYRVKRAIESLQGVVMKRMPERALEFRGRQIERRRREIEALRRRDQVALRALTEAHEEFTSALDELPKVAKKERREKFLELIERRDQEVAETVNTIIERPTVPTSSVKHIDQVLKAARDNFTEQSEREQSKRIETEEEQRGEQDEEQKKLREARKRHIERIQELRAYAQERVLKHEPAEDEQEAISETEE